MRCCLWDMMQLIFIISRVIFPCLFFIRNLYKNQYRGVGRSYSDCWFSHSDCLIANLTVIFRRGGGLYLCEGMYAWRVIINERINLIGISTNWVIVAYSMVSGLNSLHGSQVRFFPPIRIRNRQRILYVIPHFIIYFMLIYAACFMLFK